MRDIELVPDLATWYKVDFYVVPNASWNFPPSTKESQISYLYVSSQSSGTQERGHIPNQCPY